MTAALRLTQNAAICQGTKDLSNVTKNGIPADGKTSPGMAFYHIEAKRNDGQYLQVGW